MFFFQERIAALHHPAVRSDPIEHIQHIPHCRGAKHYGVLTQGQLDSRVFAVLPHQESQFSAQTFRVQLGFRLSGLQRVHFPLQFLMRKHRGNGRVGAGKVLAVFAFRADLGGDGNAVRKDAGEFNRFGFQTAGERVEKLQPFRVSDARQEGVIRLHINNSLTIARDAGRIRKRLGAACHLGSRIDAALQRLNLVRIRNHLVIRVFIAVIYADLEPDKVLIRIQRNSGIRETHQVAVFLMVINRRP